MLLFAALLLAPPVDLIDPWQRRGEVREASTARGDLVDPWSTPQREHEARPEPPPAPTSDLVDPWAVRSHAREPSRPASDLVDPWSGAPRATPGEGHAPRRELKAPYGDVPRRRVRAGGDDLRDPFSPRK